MSFNTTSFKLEISEYGEVKRTFTDTDLDEFMKRAKDMIHDHINKRGAETHLKDINLMEKIARNITYKIFTE
jgi:hypothetical protein